MTQTDFTRHSSRGFWALVALLGLVVLIGLAAAHYMEENGHIVTGMNNRIVWGLPHVFAIFLIVAASGVLNVASIGSVFGKSAYKARAPLSGLLCIALLAGGLAVLMLDLGRPERMIVAATHYNLTSVFAWNVFLYTGMFAIVARVPVDADGAANERSFPPGGARGIRLAHRADHRHRGDLRLSRRAPGLWQRVAAAAVHRDVVFVGPCRLPCHPGGALRRGVAARCRRTSSGGCATCWVSSSLASST